MQINKEKAEKKECFSHSNTICGLALSSGKEEQDREQSSFLEASAAVSAEEIEGEGRFVCCTSKIFELFFVLIVHKNSVIFPDFRLVT